MSIRKSVFRRRRSRIISSRMTCAARSRPSCARSSATNISISSSRDRQARCILRRRLRQLSLRARAARADPEALAARQVHDRRAQPARAGAIASPAPVLQRRREPAAVRPRLGPDGRAPRRAEDPAQLPRAALPRLLGSRVARQASRAFLQPGRIASAAMSRVFDDFKADPGAEYRKVLEFLELPG